MNLVSRLAGAVVCVCAASNVTLGAVTNITQTTVHATIQGAIDAAVGGDVIEADPGTYVENIDFLGKAITLRSASGNPADTTIDGGAAGRVVTCDTSEGPGTVLSGFTITNGNAHSGAGMYNLNSSPTVSNCVFSENSATNSGGGMFNGGSPTVTDCSFINNAAVYGAGGMHNGAGHPIVTDCLFVGNIASSMLASGGGVINYGANTTLTNCAFFGNIAGSSGGAIFNQTFADKDVSPTLINCVLSGNMAANAGGMFSYRYPGDAGVSSPTLINCVFSANSNYGMDNYGATPTVTNSIFWGHSMDQVSDRGGGVTSFAFCDIEGGVPAGSTDLGGNIDIDPGFVDADGPDDILGTPDDDLRLSPFSPCIDAGHDALLPTVAEAGLSAQFALFANSDFDGAALPIDLDGAPRVFDWPYLPAPAQVFSATPGLAIPDNTPAGVSTNKLVSGGPATIDRVELRLDITHTYIFDLIVTLESPAGTVVTIWDNSCSGQDNMDATFGDGLAFAACPAPFAPTAFSAQAMGAFAGENANGTWIVHVSDNFGSDTGTLNAFSIVFKPSAVDMGPYENASPPPTYIQVPTDVATIQGAIDIIADNPASRIEVLPGTYTENINLRGKAYALYSASGDPADTIIDGSGAGGVVTSSTGEGPDTVISGFTITNGNATNGGGMYCSNSSPTVTDCAFIGNAASGSGGGMYCTNSSSIVTNCAFSGNSVALGGGGMYCRTDSSPTITNCTFSLNHAGMLTGGIRFFQSNVPRLANTIVWGNTPDEVSNDQSAPSFAYCDIQGGLPGGATDLGGNIDMDPLFVDADGPDDIAGTPDDDLRLQNASPCIDAGRDALLPTIADAGLVPILGATFADAAIPHDLNGNARVFDSPHVPGAAQSFNIAPGVAIPDNDLNGLNVNIFVGGGPAMIDRLELDIDITHTWIGDLTITLESPMGTLVTVWNRSCGNFDDIMDATFGDGFDFGLCDSPFTGPAISREALGAFDGEPADGNWTLNAIDAASQDTGTVDAVAIMFKSSVVDMGPYENHSPCAGDIDGDGDTDVFDFGIFAANFMTNVAPGTNGDFDKSGLVDIFDFSIFAPDFQCPFN